MEKIRIGFSSDHRGYELKEALIKYFKHQNDISEIIDCGTDSNTPCDYPDYALKLGKEITAKRVDYGVAICGSGIGISIALNKIKGVYCAKCDKPIEASYTRLDNDTNCVAFSASTKFEDAKDIVDTFIHTEFSNIERHKKRILKIKKIESDNHD